jgi:hypothetical protein
VVIPVVTTTAATIGFEYLILTDSVGVASDGVIGRSGIQASRTTSVAWRMPSRG